MNAINVIHPYKFKGVWVFDDKAVGLKREPFIAGADTIIDVLTRNIPRAAKGFNIIFSASPFPGYTLTLDRRIEQWGGNIYIARELGMVGWLCPALLKYFDTAPQHIYVQVTKRSEGK